MSYSGEDSSFAQCTQINCVLALIVIMSECMKLFFCLLTAGHLMMDIGLMIDCVGVESDPCKT